MKDILTNKPTISAYIITKDEACNIIGAIESVRWMDEVIVLDSGSSDDTVEIARKTGAKVSFAKFQGFVAQKNAAMELCRGDWVFNLDADEEVSSELKKSIEKTVFSDGSSNMPDVYNVTRKTWYMGRWINHCGWYPEYRVRLSRRGKARWRGEFVHEELYGDCPVGYLSGDLLHKPYSDLREHLRTIGCYSELWAKREAQAGRIFHWVDLIFRPAVKFIKMYVIRAGFLDRGPGLVASFMGSWYTFMKYARLYEITKAAK